jgi:hypothetical protein
VLGLEYLKDLGWTFFYLPFSPVFICFSLFLLVNDHSLIS